MSSNGISTQTNVTSGVQSNGFALSRSRDRKLFGAKKRNGNNAATSDVNGSPSKWKEKSIKLCLSSAVIFHFVRKLPASPKVRTGKRNVSQGRNNFRLKQFERAVDARISKAEVKKKKKTEQVVKNQLVNLHSEGPHELTVFCLDQALGGGGGGGGGEGRGLWYNLI